MDLYFDNAATTRLSERALEAYIRTEREFFANPSSVHREGRKAKEELERIRESMAGMLGVKSGNLFFTSGATESIGAFFSSLLWMEPGKAITSRIEHEALSSWLPILGKQGWKCETVRSRKGSVKKEDLKELLTPDTKLVSVMAVSNVSGEIEDIKGLCECVREYESSLRHRILFFSDSVQALGKIPYSLTELGIDGASFSAHKINGPRGIGLLYLRNPGSFRSLAPAGGQEGGKRGGTENLPAIAAFEEAAKQWLLNAEENQRKAKEINTMLRRGLQEAGLEILSSENSSNYILLLSTPFPSEVFVRMLSDRGISASSGSACSNNAKGESERIMQAMGIRQDKAGNAVRISISNDTGKEDAEHLVKTVKEIINGR